MKGNNFYLIKLDEDNNLYSKGLYIRLVSYQIKYRLLIKKTSINYNFLSFLYNSKNFLNNGIDEKYVV